MKVEDEDQPKAKFQQTLYKGVMIRTMSRLRELRALGLLSVTAMVLPRFSNKTLMLAWLRMKAYWRIRGGGGGKASTDGSLDGSPC